MRKCLLLSLFWAAMAPAFSQSIYTGNDRQGFGGAVGKSTLSITDDGSSFTMTFAKGPGDFNDILVVYFDSKTGGFANTLDINDTQDGGRSAISGNGTDNGNPVTSDITFPDNFRPDYALAWGNFGSALFELVTGNNLNFINFDASQTIRTISKTAIGIGGGDPVNFKFAAVYSSGSAYKSNEAIVEDLGPENIGWKNISLSTFQLYPSQILSVRLQQFAASRVSNTVDLQWKVSCTGNYADFEVQRSSNGIDFVTIHQERATQARCNAPFDFTDVHAGEGRLYYRLRLKGDAGTITYSNIALIAAGKIAGFSIGILPTVVTSVAQLQINADVAGIVQLRILDASGRMVQSTNLQVPRGSQSIQWTPGSLRAGVYLLVATNAAGETQSLRFIKQ